MRKLAALATLAALALPAAATARPVSVHRAEQAIHRWSPDRPSIEWCARKRLGTICAIRFPLEITGPLASTVHGYAVMILWVSRTHRRVSVANVGEYLHATVDN